MQQCGTCWPGFLRCPEAPHAPLHCTAPADSFYLQLLLNSMSPHPFPALAGRVWVRLLDAVTFCCSELHMLQLPCLRYKKQAALAGRAASCGPTSSRWDAALDAAALAGWIDQPGTARGGGGAEAPLTLYLELSDLLLYRMRIYSSHGVVTGWVKSKSSFCSGT